MIYLCLLVNNLCFFFSKDIGGAAYKNVTFDTLSGFYFRFILIKHQYLGKDLPLY